MRCRALPSPYSAIAEFVTSFAFGKKPVQLTGQISIARAALADNMAADMNAAANNASRRFTDVPALVAK